MKLRDLVANSLPRVRGRKKKAPAAVAAQSPTVESTAQLETSGCLTSLDKKQAKRPSAVSRSASRDEGLELQGITEASWRGNALYRGLEAARAVKFNSRMMSTSYTSSHGMVTSHSAEGFSSQLMMMSRSYDSRMTVPDCNESCPQMSSISETCTDHFPSPQQYYHCHYHRHNHHHYHHHHLHEKSVTTPLTENQQKVNAEKDSEVKHPGNHKTQEQAKSEPGFFRKSFASLGSIRKHSNKVKKDAKENGEKLTCSVCPYPEGDASFTERKSTEKRHSKHKRKSLKGISKTKENKETIVSCDNKSWFSDNDTLHSDSSTLARESRHMFGAYETSDIRERSVESCSSRLYGSREGSSARDIDFTGFDSASLSGYESDLPRCKVHRSRSRIKTNPWLPSPQPVMAVGARGQQCDLRESTEDIAVLEESCLRLSRSMSFDSPRNREMLFQPSSHNLPDQDRSMNQRPRSLTPSDNKMVLSLNPHANSTSSVDTPLCRKVNQIGEESHDSKIMVSSTRAGTFNDLSNNAPRSRPMSTVSPNSEFVMLADNLEQLANNISFEYEEMLDCTLESVSIYQEDGQVSIQELLTDEENGNVTKQFLKSENDINNAHSPDSGIGGLGSTDGDETSTPCAQTEGSSMTTECLPSSSTVQDIDNINGTYSHVEMSTSNKVQNVHSNTPVTEVMCTTHNTSETNSTFIVSGNVCGYKTPLNITEHKNTRGNRQCLENNNSTNFSESDIDNTSFQALPTRPYTDKTVCHTKFNGGGVKNKHADVVPSLSKMENGESGTRSSTLMVDERLDIPFHPCHRQIHGSGIVMGTGGAMHEKVFRVFPEQGSGAICGSAGALCRRNTRPCVLKSNSRGPEVIHSMNDMEKSSSREQDRRSWSNEFDFPRNITINDTLESPTENWRCDDQFSMKPCQNDATLDQVKEPQQTLTNRQVNKETCSTTCFKNEELVVALVDTVKTNGSQSTKLPAPETASLDTACSPSFLMNDVSVQTDFDDDFSRWDDADTFERLEEKALDPADSTRIWLLTGNMQGSSDTGYSSLTRDSLIIMDEDSLILAGELEERAAAERLSYGESCNTDTNSNNTASDTGCLQTDSFVATTCPDKPSLLFKEIDGALTKREHTTFYPDGKITQSFSENESFVPELFGKLSTKEKISNSLKTKSQCPVLETFSSTESGFQIYRQIYDDNWNYNSSVNRSSSDSSDHTLKSSDSDDLEHNVLHKSVGDYNKTKDFETGEMKVCLRSHSGEGLFAENNSRNIPSNLPRKHTNKMWSQCSNPMYAHPTQPEFSGNLDQIRSKPELQSPFCRRGFCSNSETNPSNPATESLTPNTDRADYLEFLKDAPLNRSHLKRPLFLVPGIGTVDMSSSEQMNLFSESVTPFAKTRLPGSAATPCAPVATKMSSPSAAHCGKKIKYKTGDHTIVPSQTSTKMQCDAEQNSKSIFSSTHHQDHHQHHHHHQHQQHLLLLNKDSEATILSGNEHGQNIVPSCSSGVRYGDHRAPHPMQFESFKYSTSSQNSLKLPTLKQHPSTAEVGVVRLPEGREQLDDGAKSLRERVMSLRREKDIVFQKIQEARQDERLRQDHRLQSQGQHAHVQRKDALLETLRELKNKIEEESKLLKQRDGSNGST